MTFKNQVRIKRLNEVDYILFKVKKKQQLQIRLQNPGQH